MKAIPGVSVVASLIKVLMCAKDDTACPRSKTGLAGWGMVLRGGQCHSLALRLFLSHQEERAGEASEHLRNCARRVYVGCWVIQPSF